MLSSQHPLQLVGLSLDDLVLDADPVRMENLRIGSVNIEPHCPQERFDVFVVRVPIKAQVVLRGVVSQPRIIRSIQIVQRRLDVARSRTNQALVGVSISNAALPTRRLVRTRPL